MPRPRQILLTLTAVMSCKLVRCWKDVQIDGFSLVIFYQYTFIKTNRVDQCLNYKAFLMQIGNMPWMEFHLKR